MTNPTTKLEERSNPAAVGFRWTSESGRAWEIVWQRSADRPWLLGIQGEDGKWNTSTHTPGIPRAKNITEARRIAREFVDAGNDDD